MDPENLRRSSPPTRRESDALCGKRYCWTMVVIAHSVGHNCLRVLTALPFVTALMLNSCAHSRPVWDYYDQCAQENPSFLAMAHCGKQKRLSECVPNNSCSSEGTAFMRYVDTLVRSVENNEMTEAEAMERYAQYKSGGAPTTRPDDTGQGR
jgi:hypothetical protein